MRVVCISDTHGLHARMKHPVPDGDLLVHAGDLSRSGRLSDLSSVEVFFAGLPHRHKVYIPGNHDWCFQREESLARAAIPSARCLIDECVTVEGFKVWGSPWQPEFMDWAFNLPRGESLAAVWRRIPDDTDIVITHGPPRGIGDCCSDGRHEGCDDLLLRMKALKPKLHVFGHIHEAYEVVERDGTIYANASICNLGYQPVNAPLVFDLA